MQTCLPKGRDLCLLLFASSILALPVTAGPVVRGKHLPPPARRVIEKIMRRSGLHEVLVTSAERTPAEQARAMFGFIRRHGSKAAFELYGPEGDAVIREYLNSKDAAGRRKLLGAMASEVRRQLPSAHANDRLMHTRPSHFVFDVSLRKMPRGKRRDFIEAARLDPRVSRVLGPREGEKGCLHIEIPKNIRAVNSPFGFPEPGPTVMLIPGGLACRLVNLAVLFTTRAICV